jgi:four helix bundle protein
MPFAFEDLNVYWKALDFSVKVIENVDKMDLPRKHFRLIEQLESCSSSVAMNISEGKGRYTHKDFKKFLYIARGSLYETVTMLQIFKRLNWLNENTFSELYDEALEVNRMLAGLINAIGEAEREK